MRTLKVTTRVTSWIYIYKLYIIISNLETSQWLQILYNSIHFTYILKNTCLYVYNNIIDLTCNIFISQYAIVI